jgi:hypothetical protein
MEFEVQEINETVSDDANRAAEVAIGAVAEAADAAAHPVGTVRKQVRRFEKKGEPIKRSLQRRVERTAEGTMDATYDVVSGALPERVALAGIRVLRSQAERKDIFGDFAYRTLQLMNGGLERALKTLNKFENASEPPARATSRRSRPATRRGRGTRRTSRPRGQVRRTRRTRTSAARSA